MVLFVVNYIFCPILHPSFCFVRSVHQVLFLATSSQLVDVISEPNISNDSILNVDSADMSPLNFN